MSERVTFTKMSGAGNDFLVLDARSWESLAGDRAAWVRAVCRRGLSVGADGVLVVTPGSAGCVRVLFFNPDGGEAFCGNGTRCAARYALTRGIAAGPSMKLDTAAGEVPAVVSGGSVDLTLAPPEDLGDLTLEASGEAFHGRWVRVGVPHFVVAVHGLPDYPLWRVGPLLRRHPRLGAQGANVNLVEEDPNGAIHVRTFERGVENETLACGTGAVAVAFAARLAGGPDETRVVPKSGSVLTVSLPGDANRPSAARLIGDARFVFEGSLDAEATLVPS